MKMSLVKPQLVLICSLLVSACNQSSEELPGSGAGDPTPTPNTIIDIDKDGFPSEVDCDDNNQLTHELKTFYTDADLDGYGSMLELEVCALEPVSGQSLTNNDPDDSVTSITPFDKDGDGTLVTTDCNDLDDTLSIEISYYADDDSDSFGAGEPLTVCSNSPPFGFVLSSSDPDDTNPLVVPGDTDGDGVANADDCNPGNVQEYYTQVYYDDNDADNIGGGDPVNMCVSLPIPTLDGYSLTSGDSCPDRFNSNKDFDEDAIDDVCDMEIRLLSDKVISGDQMISFIDLSNKGKTFYFGDAGHPVRVEFNEGAHLHISYNATLHLEGGSSLHFNKTSYNKTPYLSLYGSSLSGAGRIKGIGSDNRIEMRGADFFFNNGTEIDGIEQILITTKKLYNPAKQQDIKYTSLIYYDWADLHYLNSRGYAASADIAPTIKNSPGEIALIVQEQMLDVAPIRFLNNSGYPIRCDGDDFYREENQYAVYSTCQYAAYSRYEGNMFNGPLLFVSYVDNFPTQDYWYDPEMASLNIGSKELYIQNFSVHVFDDIARSVDFENYTLKAAHVIGRDSSGTMVDYGLATHKNSIPFFRAYNPGFSAKAYINFYDSDVSEVPLIIDGGKIAAYGSKVGAVIFPYGTYSSNVFGTFYANNSSTLDFASSPYVVTDGINNYGLGIPRNFYGVVQIGRDIGDNPATTQDLIISDSSIHYPIFDASSMQLWSTTSSDLITASNFKLTKSVGFEGTDLESVFTQDSSVISIYLKKK